MESTKHRKTIRHYNVPNHAHLLTFTCYQGRPLLDDDARRRWLSHQLDVSLRSHGFSLVAFVYMLEHVHLLVWPSQMEYETEALLYAVKKPFSDTVKRILKREDPELLNALTVLERPGKKVFRFWQKGPGHDRNIMSRDALVKAAEYIHNNPVRRGLVPTPDLWKWSSWSNYYRPGLAKDVDLPRIDGFPP